MIEFDRFVLASAPRTGTTWFRKAAADVGLGAPAKFNVHIPPPEDYTGFVVTLVRHPYDWLVSYYLSLKGGAIGVPAVDQFCNIARGSYGVYDFLAQYVRLFPGEVSKMFDLYRASSVLRLEDFPWAVISFFETIDATIPTSLKDTPLQNARKGEYHIPNKKLKQQVVEAEADFCERYEYF